jgi:hypothetical protein
VVDARISPTEAVFAIKHEGPGIEVAKLPMNLEAAASDSGWLGGFVMLPSVMDDVHYEDHGRAIVLIKKATASTGGDELEVGDSE